MAISPYSFQVAEIAFTVFNLESASRCQYDWVKIFDGTTEVMTKCGTSSPGTFTSSGNTARVEFHSDSSATRTGFSATVNFVDDGACPAGPGPCPGGPAEMVMGRKTQTHKHKIKINTNIQTQNKNKKATTYENEIHV